MSDGGKGSKPRPISISNEDYAARWDAIFAKPGPKPQPCSWKFTDIDSHKNEHWYICETCGAADWIASYGSISQLKCPNSA